MTLHAPQIIYVVLLLLGVGIDLAKHGQPKTGKHSFPSSFFAAALILALLYWGGFFGKSFH
jgi:hypothetical protein